MDAWIVIALIAVIVWYWKDSLRSREFAVQKCRSFCAENNVQLLDQSVHVTREQLARYAGRIALRRYYVFDFSIDGTDRYHGVAVVCGSRMQYLSLLHPQGEIICGQMGSSSNGLREIH